MKAFEKWLKKDQESGNGWTVSDNALDALEEGWKAALEWIHSAGVICEGELAGKLIKEELHNESI